MSLRYSRFKEMVKTLDQLQESENLCFSTIKMIETDDIMTLVVETIDRKIVVISASDGIIVVSNS